MADERDDQFGSNGSNGQQTAGQQSQRNEFGQQGQENMSNAAAPGDLSDDDTGGATAPQERGGRIEGTEKASGLGAGGGQPIGGNDSNSGSGTTLTQGADFEGQSASGQTQSSSGTGGDLSGEGFIGSGADPSGEYLQEGHSRNGSTPSDASGSSSAEATDGSDFAKGGRGALEDEESGARSGD